MRKINETGPGIWSVFKEGDKLPCAQFIDELEARVYACAMDAAEEARDQNTINTMSAFAARGHKEVRSAMADWKP